MRVHANLNVSITVQLLYMYKTQGYKHAVFKISVFLSKSTKRAQLVCAESAENVNYQLILCQVRFGYRLGCSFRLGVWFRLRAQGRVAGIFVITYMIVVMLRVSKRKKISA